MICYAFSISLYIADPTPPHITAILSLKSWLQKDTQQRIIHTTAPCSNVPSFVAPWVAPSFVVPWVAPSLTVPWVAPSLVVPWVAPSLVVPWVAPSLVVPWVVPSLVEP